MQPASDRRWDVEDAGGAHTLRGLRAYGPRWSIPARKGLIEKRLRVSGTRRAVYGPTEYFVNAPPAWANEFGPSAA